MAAHDPSGIEELSPRERDVIDLMAKGLTNGEIADRLNISFATAKNHVSAVIGKLGVETREEAVQRWREEERVRARISRAFWGLLGFTPLKLGGMAAAAGAIAVGTFAAIDSIDPDPPGVASAASETSTPTATPDWPPTPTPRHLLFETPEPPRPREPRCAIDFDSADSLAAMDLGPETVELRGVPNSNGPGVCLQMRSTPAPDAGSGRPTVQGPIDEAMLWEDAQHAGYPYLCSGGLHRRAVDVSYAVVLCPLSGEVTRVTFAEDGAARDLDIHSFPASFGTDMQFVLFRHSLDVVRLMEYYDADGTLIYRPFPVPNLDDLSPGRVDTPEWTEIEYTGGDTGSGSWNDGQGVFKVSDAGPIRFRIESNTQSPPRIIVFCSPAGTLDLTYLVGPDEHGSGVFAIDIPAPQPSCRFLVPSDSHGPGQYTVRPIVEP